MQTGTRGTLQLDGAGFVLPFTVRDSDANVLHLVFQLDDATAAKFEPVLELLAFSRAA